MPILQPIGRTFLVFLEATGRLSLFTALSLSHCLRPPFYPRLVLRQMVEIGYYSLPVVGLTAIFTGMVLRSEEHTSELQSLMRISYAVFCLKKKKNTHIYTKPQLSRDKN